MEIEKVITIANSKVRLQFLAMERSLRAAGCDLPLLVIPYDDDLFELPDNCFWWRLPRLWKWVEHNRLWWAFRKIQCLTTANYQFVDSDVIFLRNPKAVLEDCEGFVTSCGHWNNPEHTYTAEMLPYLRKKSTNWTRFVFNSGQWACDRQLYDEQGLMHFCENNYKETLFVKNYEYKDQAGINLLVNLTDVPITNLTLPPTNMESTWAGHYKEDYDLYWRDSERKPYLIHWAGVSMDELRPINNLFYDFLTAAERAEWTQQVQQSKKSKGKTAGSIRAFAGRSKRALQTLIQS